MTKKKKNMLQHVSTDFLYIFSISPSFAISFIPDILSYGCLVF